MPLSVFEKRISKRGLKENSGPRFRVLEFTCVNLKKRIERNSTYFYLYSILFK